MRHDGMGARVRFGDFWRTSSPEVVDVEAREPEAQAPAATPRGQKAPPFQAQGPRGSVTVPARPRGLLDRIPREDIDVLVFSTFLGGLTLTGSLFTGADLWEATGRAVMTWFAAPLYVYGTKVLRRASPETAAAVYESAQAWGPVLGSKGSPTLQGSEGTPWGSEGARGSGRGSEGTPLYRTSLPPRTLRVGLEDAEGDSVEDTNRKQMLRFLLAGKLAGTYAARRLAADVVDEGGRVTRPRMMTESAWRRYSEYVQLNGLMEKAPGGLRFAPGFDYATASKVVKTGALRLPARKLPDLAYWDAARVGQLAAMRSW